VVHLEQLQTMLEHCSLLIQAWTRTTLPDGEIAWIRTITDGEARPLGFVRYQKLPALSWLFWLRTVRLDVFETEDAAHLMRLTRSWAMLRIWDLHDSEDRHVGSVYPKSLVSSEGQSLGFLDVEYAEQGRILDPSGHVLLRFGKKKGDNLEVEFAPDPAANPFLRMMLLGCLLTIDPGPKRA
jgi:hypothetical protein